MAFEWANEALANAQLKSLGAGYYNSNYAVTHDGTPYVFRVPIPYSDLMDLRLIPEKDVLLFLETVGFPAPRLVHAAPADRYFLHSFVSGTCLNDVYPDCQPLPDWIPGNLASQMRKLHTYDSSSLAGHCRDLAASPDTRTFFRSLIASVREIYDRVRPEFGGLLAKLRIPDDPLAVVEGTERGLSFREFTLCHADVHRKNLMYDRDRGTLTFLDWELSLVADPVYDIAVHLHKMRYSGVQEERFIAAYLEQAGLSYLLASYRNEIRIYRSIEHIKSAIVDAVRYAKDLRVSLLSEGQRLDYARRYRSKLAPAWALWGLPADDLRSGSEWVLPLLLSA